MNKIINHLSNVKIIAIGFAVIILIGTLLLMLPISSHAYSISFIDALFTATSASCVTGLVVVDTYQYWTLFGQLIILLLIQIGGLGFITIGVFFASYLKKKISLKQRGLIEESVNTLHLSGGVRLVKRIIKGTFFFETLGAILLSSVFIKDFGLVKGIYYGIFHSVSAFCNAGFDLFGYMEPYCSLVYYADNILVNTVIMLLIVIGGIGFIVWDDIFEHKLYIHRYLLQTKVVLLTTFLLIVLGTLFFYVFEYHYSLSGLSFNEQILASCFQSITARTAGFNTLDVTKMSTAGKLLLMLLMFVGGSPGSTAGGIKTTTFAVLIVFIYSVISNKTECNIFNRRFEIDVIKKACTVLLMNLMLVVIGVISISFFQSELLLEDILFEVFSAMGTVGISTGITRNLVLSSKIVIIILMYSGRVGSLTFALSLTRRKNVKKCINPSEKIAIG